jgi:hypothetical protein
METDIFKHIKIITYEVFVLSKLQSNTFLSLKITYLTDHILEMNKTVWLSEWLMQASTLKFVRYQLKLTSDK